MTFPLQNVIFYKYAAQGGRSVSFFRHHRTWRVMIIGGNRMYAIIATGGKQYKVAEGDIIKVEKLNVEAGSEVKFDVIAINNDKDMLVGEAVANSSVSANVIEDGKAKKVVVYKYKRKTGYHKKNGHRQPFTKVQITAINA